MQEEVRRLSERLRDQERLEQSRMFEVKSEYQNQIRML